MSDPKPSDPKPITQIHVVEGVCGNPSCKKPIQMPFPPIPIFNDTVVSVVSVPHPQGIECLHCGTYHNLIIYPPATSICLAIVPMEKPILNEDKRVLPFTGHLKALKGN